MSGPACELVDLEDLLGHKAFQWFLWKAKQSWGPEAVMQRIEALQNAPEMTDGMRKEQVNQVIVSRRAINDMLTEIDREISKRRQAIAERPDAMAGERRRGDVL